MSEENLNFYLGRISPWNLSLHNLSSAVEKLKTQKGKKDSKVKAEAEKIYRKYLQRGAVYEINLGPDVKRQIDKDIQGMAQN